MRTSLVQVLDKGTSSCHDYYMNAQEVIALISMIAAIAVVLGLFLSSLRWEK